MPDAGIHLAIIPDGNRRWARAKGMHPWEGHRKAIENFRTLADFCRNHPRISVLTIWCFSTENWKRDPREVRELMTMLEEYLRRERTQFREQKTRFVHAGRKDRIPRSLAALIAETESHTADQTDFTLQLALDYGGKDAILRAIRALNRGTTMDEETFRRSLDHPELPDIDLIIRTSGEFRTSNFFLWEATYAEWIFLEKHFPDFEVRDVEEALATFQTRQRRLGS